MKATAAELQRSNEDLSQFSYVASHDLRSPLNTILQFTELLEREYGAVMGEGKALLDFVKTAARRMNRLIEDLLSYARFSQDTTERYEFIDTTPPLQMAIENLRVKRRKRVRLSHTIRCHSSGHMKQALSKYQKLSVMRSTTEDLIPREFTSCDGA